MTLRHRLSRPVGLFLVGSLASLALTSCSGGDGSADEPATVEITHADGTKERVPAKPTTWPLTGLDAKNGGKATRPVLVSKIDNTPSSAPQMGLSQADLVIEELVEGGVTRLAAFYYSQIPGTVGPIRSMRASDIGIVTPAKAQVVTSGAAQVTLDRVGKAGIDYITEGDAGVSRDSGRAAPYNLFANLTDISAGLKQKASRPEDYLPWGDAADLAKGVAATSLTANFGNHTTSWEFADGTYDNVNTYAAEGDEFPADSVLVLRVKVGDAGYLDPAGSPVPETKFVGSGPALLFHDGRLVRGTWSKKELVSPLRLSIEDTRMLVPAGKVWIELVPAVDGDVTFAK